MKRIINRIRNLDIKRMIKMINVVKKRSGHSFLWIFFDIFRCFIKFGSGYMDYYLFYFEELTDEEKSTYINISVNKKYVRKLNNPKYYDVLNDKVKFLNTYKSFIRREFLDIREVEYEEFEKFVKKHPEFIVKPIDGFCGYGVELINSKDKDLHELFATLKSKGQTLLEERIVQNKEVSAIYPYSINTIRIVTLLKDEDVKVMFTCMRIGNKGKVVDNFNNGGMFAPIDENGVICRVALDKDNIAYDSHPMTNTNIVGFKIPHFDEVVDLCKQLAKVTPELGLCGWDIAITEKGIDVVEGNQLPGYDIYQSKEHLAPSRLGLKPKFDDAIYPDNKDKKGFAKGFNFIKFIWIVGFAILIKGLFNCFDINVDLIAYSAIFYLIFYRKIESRPLYKTIIMALILSIFTFIFEYATTYITYSSILENDYFFFIKNITIQVISYALWIVIKTVVLTIAYNYFILPLFDILIEKSNKTLGIVITILMFCLTIVYFSLLFYLIAFRF